MADMISHLQRFALLLRDGNSMTRPKSGSFASGHSTKAVLEIYPATPSCTSLYTDVSITINTTSHRITMVT